MIWVRKLSESSFTSVSPNETWFTQFPNLKSLDFGGVVDFRVIDMGSPWTGGQCFVHQREKEGVQKTTRSVMPERAPTTWVSLAYLPLYLSTIKKFCMLTNQCEHMLGFFSLVHVWVIFQRQFIIRGSNFSLCGGVRHIQDIMKWSPFGKCPAVKTSCSDGFHRTKWRQEWEYMMSDRVVLHIVSSKSHNSVHREC